jgi:3-oxoacyl-[acyl-carrier-protein] synthase II
VRAAIAITGQGAVCALGLGLDAIWTELAAGRDGIRVIERFSTDGFSTHLAGMVPLEGRAAVDDPDATRARCIDYAVRAGREALMRAKVHVQAPRRVALVLGTSMGSHLGGLHEISAEVAAALGLEGPAITVSTACASSTNALGVGRDLLDQGLADVVLAGGSDVLAPEIFAGFHALGLLSATKCSPFSEAVGTTLGEGAGFLVLERAPEAEARGAPFVACLSGYALSGDGYHATSPEPSGAGVARALRGTLEDAGLLPDDVGYVNAHGTGTAANDPAEWQAISQVVGPRVEQLAVSSTKSYLAHAQGAAGVLELISTLLAMQHGQVLPTLHFTRPRRRGPVDPVAQERPRALEFEHALCTNSAFGGANAVVAVSRKLVQRRVSKPRSVFIAGAASIEMPTPVHPERSRGAPGHLESKRSETQSPSESSTPLGQNGGGPFRLETLVPTADTRGMDPSSIFLTAAAALALNDAKLTISGAARERTGIFAGTTNASPTSWEEFRGSVKQRGLAKASAPAFTRLVLNSSSGTASRLLGLRGPTTTVTCGQGSGLLALVLAAIHLQARTDADCLVVAAVDEVDRPRDPHGVDGAAALVLTTTPNDLSLAGWAIAGAQSLPQAIAHACEMAGLEPITPVKVMNGAVASGSLQACVDGVNTLRLGAGHLLITDVSIAASCAVVLERSTA